MKYKYLLLLVRLLQKKIFLGNRLILNSFRIGFEERIKIIIKGSNSLIHLKKNIYLMRNGNLEVYNGGKISIGENVSINKNFSIVSRKNITLGNDISIGPNCCIYDHDHSFEDEKKLIREQQYNSKPIEIQDNVWIASNVFIGKGVKIGKGSIIGSGSVVVKNVEPYTIVGGVPSKLLKNRF